MRLKVRPGNKEKWKWGAKRGSTEWNQNRAMLCYESECTVEGEEHNQSCVSLAAPNKEPSECNKYVTLKVIKWLYR